VIEAPTRHVWLLMRIQSDDPERAEAIARLQQQFVLTRMEADRASERGHSGPRTLLAPQLRGALKAGTPPPRILMGLDAQSFFGWASQLWGAQAVAVPPSDAAFVASAKALGLRPGAALIWNDLTPLQRAALQGAMKLGMQRLAAEAVKQGGGIQDGWYYLEDNWYRVDAHRVLQQQPANYALRTGLAIEALGFLPLQEATYVAAGVPRVGGESLSGAGGRRYVVRFAPGQLPPVDAFWSLTVYSGAGYLVGNPIDRYSLGSKDDLKRDADGGVTLQLASSNPHGADSDEISNWLPIPDGEFSVQFRAYAPTESIRLGGDGWHVPPVQAR
jgi:hypothetical protein